MLRFLPHSTQIRFISSNEIDFKIENARNMVHFKRKYPFIVKLVQKAMLIERIEPSKAY